MSEIAWEAPLILASASPRRRRMLQEAEVEFEVEEPPLDDAALATGAIAVDAAAWAMAMAYLKARAVSERRAAAGRAAGTVLGADTVCAAGGGIFGQPRDAEEARRMLRGFRRRAHEVISGVALVDVKSGRRRIFFDRAIVRWGNVSDEAIEAYVASGDWRGKAGAYNLAERLASGWPIECEGDPATVMGLPMRRLLPLLRGAAPSSAEAEP